MSKEITHFLVKRLFYLADDELVEALQRLSKEQLDSIRAYPWINGRIMNALSKLEPNTT